MKVLMISSIPLESEGRFMRCHNAFSKFTDVSISSPEKLCKNPIERDAKDFNVEKKGLKHFIEYTLQTIKSTKNIDYDVLYIHNYYSCLAGHIISFKNKRKKIVYDAYELFYPKSKVKFSLRDRFFYFIEKAMIKRADVIIAASRDRALVMQGHYGLWQLPVDIENITSQTSHDSKTCKVSQTIKIVYAGGIYNDRGLFQLAEATEGEAEGRKIQLDIYGTGPYYHELLELIHKKGFAHVKMYGAYENRELTNILQQYDVGYVSYQNDCLNNIYCASNKICDYVNAGIPIISMKNYTIQRMIDEFLFGYCDDDLRLAITKVVSNYDEFLEGVINIRKYMQKYSIEKKVIEVLCLLSQ